MTMKSTEFVDMAQLTAFVTSLSQMVSSNALRLGLAATVLLLGLYLHLVPNSITVSRPPDVTLEQAAWLNSLGPIGFPEEKASARPPGLAVHRQSLRPSGRGTGA